MQIKTVDPATLEQWLAQGITAVVDVREPAEYRAAHIAEAINVPLAQVSAASLPRKDCAIVVHCQKGARGASACEKLLNENPDLKIYNLAGGLDAWAAVGRPVNAGGSFVLPLDRQVQLSIGLVLLVASFLILFVSKYFVAIPAVFGLGLTLAGATGFCGLARLMSYAPWNK